MNETTLQHRCAHSAALSKEILEKLHWMSVAARAMKENEELRGRADPERLAHLLAQYDLDAPYGPGESPPPLPIDEFREMLTTGHCGDRVGLPASCPRCFADRWIAMAEWVAAEMGK